MVEHVIGADGAFTLAARNSDIRLRAVPGDTVRIRARDGSDLRRLDTEPGDGMLVAVRARGGALPDLDIEVPVDAAIIVEGSSSDLAAIGLRGEQRYRTASGDIDLHDVGGRLAIEAVSGDVNVMAAAPAELSARTVSGDMAVRAGSITRLRAVTTSGDLHVAGSFDGAGPFAIETVSGDATLAPANGLRVEAHRSPAMSVPTSTPGPRGRVAGGRVVVGGGGPEMTFRSTSGDLRIVPAAVLAPVDPVAPPPRRSRHRVPSPDVPVDPSPPPSTTPRPTRIRPPTRRATRASPSCASWSAARSMSTRRCAGSPPPRTGGRSMADDALDARPAPGGRGPPDR